MIWCNLWHVINSPYLHKDKLKVYFLTFLKHKTKNHSYMKLKCEKTQRLQKHCSISFKIDSNYHKLFWWEEMSSGPQTLLTSTKSKFNLSLEYHHDSYNIYSFSCDSHIKFIHKWQFSIHIGCNTSTIIQFSSMKENIHNGHVTNINLKVQHCNLLLFPLESMILRLFCLTSKSLIHAKVKFKSLNKLVVYKCFLFLNWWNFAIQGNKEKKIPIWTNYRGF